MNSQTRSDRQAMIKDVEPRALQILTAAIRTAGLAEIW